MKPAGFPYFRVHFPPRRWPGLPWQLEQGVIFLGKLEECLSDPDHERMWWRHLRQSPGQCPCRVPTWIEVRVGE